MTGDGYKVEAFGKCFYYGYEFAEQVDGGVRSAFIKYLKFSNALQESSDLTRFIQKSINDLNAKINLYDYDLVIMPESSSQVNRYMMRYIYRFAQPMLHEMQLVKALPENVAFDMAGYEKQYLNDELENLKFNSDEVAQLCASIRKNNVLIIDDIATSGSTLNEILRTLRILNEDNQIAIFSLIGRKDLMVETM